MNISHEHKIIWWAPERCGTKATANIFRKLGFEFFQDETETSKFKMNDGTDYQSHNIKYPEKYGDYKIICSIRNPYDRMSSIFSNFTNVGKSFVYTKNNPQKLTDTYGSIIKQILPYNYLVNHENLEKTPMQSSYLTKYRFDTQIPDFFIKMESLEEDLGKLDFVRESEIWKSGYVHDYLIKNQHIRLRPYKFNDIYTFESAKRVYEYHKKQFIICGYDPFSFTKEQLSNEDKMKFVHDIL